MMKTISLIEFFKSYREKAVDCPSYRMGQHFINLFVEDDCSDEIFSGLWEETNNDVVCKRILSICYRYQWDLNALAVREGREDML